MKLELILPFLAFALGTVITPGPNNITSASAGIQWGYKKTMPYLIGISCGFLFIMLISGLFTSYISSVSQVVFNVLKWLGASYLIYLAVVPLLKRPSGTASKKALNYSFLSGFGLQLINPKTLIYGMTIYSSFAVLVSGSVVSVIISAISLSLVAFTCTSLWAILGTTLSKYFERVIFYYCFNGILGILLIYVAITIIYI